LLASKGKKMDQELYHFLKERLEVPEALNGNKVMDLSEAVRKFVKPEMSIQTGNGMATGRISKKTCCAPPSQVGLNGYPIIGLNPFGGFGVRLAILQFK
jgi:hypothetical protein